MAIILVTKELKVNIYIHINFNNNNNKILLLKIHFNKIKSKHFFLNHIFRFKTLFLEP